MILQAVQVLAEGADGCFGPVDDASQAGGSGIDEDVADVEVDVEGHMGRREKMEGIESRHCWMAGRKRIGR